MATTINVGRVAMVPKGEWDATTAYVRLDVVLYNGSSWVAIADSTGQVPAEGSTYWQILSLKGEQGEKGDKGDTGATGATGAKGDKGDTGATGAAGATGPQGPKGDKGDKGDQGNSGYTGAAGELEVVNNLTDGGSEKGLSAEMGKVLGNALKTNGTLMNIRAYSQEQFDALQTLEDNTIYLIGILGGFVNVSSTLTNCTNSNQATKTLLGGPYNATLTADKWYEMSTVIVYMNSVDVTSQVYSNGVISIASVDGDIAITATATQASLPVMRDLGVWLDAKDNLNDGSYHDGATKWVSKVECGSLGNIEFSLLGEVSFVDGVARFAPTEVATTTSIYGINPLCAEGLGAIGSGDVTIEIVLNSQFTRFAVGGDSIYLVGVNYSSMPTGRWRFGLYNASTKDLDVWCNDGSGKFATLANSTPSAGKQTLCFVRQNGVVTFYRNGASVGSVTPQTQKFSTSSTVHLCIGNQSNGNSSNCLTGDVYDVKVYGRALTAEEVAFNHNFNNMHYNLGL